MPNTNEQRLDVVDSCNALLYGALKPFKQVDDTPEGRMITQVKWLMERANNNDLSLPVEDVYTSSLRYIYTDGELMRNASSSDPSVAWSEIGIYMHRLMVICVGAKLITKPAFYPYVVRCTNALINLLQNPPRELTDVEKNAIVELQKLRRLVEENKIDPPMISYFPEYKNLRQVYSMTGSSIDDIPNGKILIKTVTHLFFEGVRPDTWLTPEDADRETRQWA